MPQRRIYLKDRTAVREMLEWSTWHRNLAAGTRRRMVDLYRRDALPPAGIPAFLRLGGYERESFACEWEIDTPAAEISAVRQENGVILIAVNGENKICLAQGAAVFGIPADFSGLLLVQLGYEKIFPNFAALPKIRGLDLFGNTDNIENWSALYEASSLTAFRFAGSARQDLSPALPAALTSLTLVSQAVSLPAAAAETLRILRIENLSEGDTDYIRSLKDIGYIETKISLVCDDDHAGYLSRLLEHCVPGDGEGVPQTSRRRNRGYHDGYMSQFYETQWYSGSGGTGWFIKEVSETHGDGSWNTTRDWVEFVAHGLPRGAELRAKSFDKKGITLFVAGSRDFLFRVLDFCQLEIQWSKRGGAPAPAREGLPPMGDDLNRAKFADKSRLFAEIARNVIYPPMERVCAAHKAEGLDAECALNIESPDDPERYSGQIYLQFWSKDRSRWSLLQYSQTASVLEPVTVSIWNPDTWAWSNLDLRLAEITPERAHEILDRFCAETGKILHS